MRELMKKHGKAHLSKFNSVCASKIKTMVTRSPAIAARHIRAGSLAAFPTETVYGLGASAFDANAVRKIFKAKGRPADNPLIVHVHSKRQIAQVAKIITPAARKIIAKFFPGPVSVVLPKSSRIPKVATGGLDTVCVRMPSLPITIKFLRACRVPVAAPSANISGMPSPTSWKHVLHDLGGKIPVILKGPPARHGVESTVIDCTGAMPRLLRAGSLPIEEIEKTAGKIISPKRAGKPLSPGMKYRHYAPMAKVIVVASAQGIPKNARNFAYIGQGKAIGAALSFRPKSDAQYAKRLFAFFRECDERGIASIYSQKTSLRGMGRAIMERLAKASGR